MNIAWRIRVVCFLVLAAFASFAFYYMKFYVSPKPHGIILFVAPGLSPELLALAENNQNGKQFKVLSTPNQVALVKTRIPGSMVGDLPSLLSAVSSGQRVLRGQVGVGVTGNSLDNLIYKAQRGSRSIGIVSTSSLTAPSVSPFYAHTIDATIAKNIAPQLLDSTSIDLIMGGGGQTLEETSSATGRYIMHEASLKGYRVIKSKKDLNETQPWRMKKLLGVFAANDFDFRSDVESAGMTDSIPTLAEMTRVSIQRLQYNLGGYLLVIEHGLIGKAVSENRSALATREVTELDEAIDTALHYAGRNTIIMVYSPMTTGGLQILRDPNEAHNDEVPAAIPSISWHNGPGAIAPAHTKNAPIILPRDPAAFPAKAALPTAGYGTLFIFSPNNATQYRGILDPRDIHLLISNEL